MRPALPLLLLGAVAATAFGAAPPPGPNDAATRTPIRHLVIVVGEMTGVPMLLNTSFNENEPVVCSPEEALDCFLRTKMDVLVLENFFICRSGA